MGDADPGRFGGTGFEGRKARPAPLEQELPLGNLLKIIIVRTYPFGHVPIVGHAPRGILGHSALAVLVPIGHTLVRPDHSTDCSIDFLIVFVMHIMANSHCAISVLDQELDGAHHDYWKGLIPLAEIHVTMVETRSRLAFECL
jgi:hypothetical protein